MANFSMKGIARLITFYDVILVIVILLVSISILVSESETGKQTLLIYYQDGLMGTYNLSKDSIIKINENCLAEISKRRIRMLKSDCPDKLCVKHSWSESAPIICLPNKIVLEIHAKDGKHDMHILH